MSVRAKSRTEEQKAITNVVAFLFKVMLNLFQHILIRPVRFIANCGKNLTGLFNIRLQKHNPLATFG